VITFNDLLEKAGLDPRKVKLARHQDGRGKDMGLRPYYLWQAADGRFETYQRIQSDFPFKNANHLAAFVVSPAGETIFVGLFDIGVSIGVVPAGTFDPVVGSDVSGHNLYDLTPNPAALWSNGERVNGDGFNGRKAAKRFQNPSLKSVPLGMRRNFQA